jgi:hypothetical protein
MQNAFIVMQGKKLIAMEPKKAGAEGTEVRASV